MIVSVRDMLKASETWADFWGFNGPEQWSPASGWHKLERYVGCRISMDVHLTGTHEKRFKALLGPHANTMLAAWCAREGIERK